MGEEQEGPVPSSVPAPAAVGPEGKAEEGGERPGPPKVPAPAANGPEGKVEGKEGSRPNAPALKGKAEKEE